MLDWMLAIVGCLVAFFAYKGYSGLRRSKIIEEEARKEEERAERLRQEAQEKITAERSLRELDEREKRLRALQSKPIVITKSGKSVFGPIIAIRHIPSGPRTEKMDTVDHLAPIVNEWLDKGYPHVEVFGSLERYGGPSYRMVYINKYEGVWIDDLWRDP